MIERTPISDLRNFVVVAAGTFGGLLTGVSLGFAIWAVL